MPESVSLCASVCLCVGGLISEDNVNINLGAMQHPGSGLLDH